MHYHVFLKLVGIVSPIVSKRPSHYPFKQIPDGIRTAIGMRWMSVSSANALRDLFDVSLIQVFHTQQIFLIAILSCKDLAITLDKDQSIQILYNEIH